jgi:hypothetical protein
MAIGGNVSGFDTSINIMDIRHCEPGRQIRRSNLSAEIASVSKLASQ